MSAIIAQDVLVVEARCQGCGFVAHAVRLHALAFELPRALPVVVSAQRARELSQGTHSDPLTNGCDIGTWLLALEPVPEDAA